MLASALASFASSAESGATRRDAATSHAAVSPIRTHLVSFAARVDPHQPRLSWSMWQTRAALVACAWAAIQALARLRNKTVPVFAWRGSATRRGPPSLRNALI
jgi:hypothetical protein